MPSNRTPPDEDSDRVSCLAGHSESFPTFGLAEATPSDTAAGMSLVGTSLGERYQLLELIGTGGFGWVFRARQHFPARDVAVKVPRQPTRMSRRFRDEANLLGTLEHEGIATVFDAGTFTFGGVDTPYVVMQLIRNARRIDAYCEDRLVSLHQRLNLFLTVCEAVAHAHRQGIVHRDLKPGNILVDGEGRPHVIDFGIATFMVDAPTSIHLPSFSAAQTTATQTRGAVGTRDYMSPEQRIPGRKVDARADVYALGKVLRDIVTAGGAALPAALEKVSRRCLEHQPCDRYADAIALAAGVRESLAENTALARPATASGSGWHLSRHVWPRPIVIAIAAGLLVAVLSVFFPWVPPDPAPRAGMPAYVQSLQALATSLANNSLAEAPAAWNAAEQIWRDSSPRNEAIPLELAVLRGLATRDPAASGIPHVSHAIVDPTEQWLAAGNADASVSLARLSEPHTPVHRLSGLRSTATSLRFSSDGSLVLGADDTGRICSWNLATISSDAAPRRFHTNHMVGSRAAIGSIDISQDGRMIVTADSAGRIGIWATDSGTRLREVVIPESNMRGTFSVCFDSTNHAVIGCPDGTILTWPGNGEPRRIHPGHRKGPVLLARSTEAAVIASAGSDGELCLRDGTTAALLGSSINLEARPQSIGLTPDGTRLFVACLPADGPKATTKGVIKVFGLDSPGGRISPTLLVDIPVPYRVDTINLATTSCVAVLDSPDHPAVVWQWPHDLTADGSRPAGH